MHLFKILMSKIDTQMYLSFVLATFVVKIICNCSFVIIGQHFNALIICNKHKFHKREMHHVSPYEYKREIAPYEYKREITSYAYKMNMI